MDRARYKQVATVGSTTETTVYVGGLYEKVVSNGVTTHRHYIQAGNEIIALYITRSNGVNELRYLLRDHLGSIDAITNPAGQVPILERLSYDAFGKDGCRTGRMRADR